MKPVILGELYGSVLLGATLEERRFAATVLDDYLNFTQRKTSCSKQVDFVHKHDAEYVLKETLAPKMSNDELSEFLLRETLEDNKEGDILRLLFLGRVNEQATIPI